MKRFLILGILFTIPLSAKTLDNKAFCELIAQGREATELKRKGLTVKGERLQGEVETKLKTFITVGTQILPDENLRVIKRRGILPEYVIQCLDIKFTDEMKKEFASEKKYYKNAGSFWICYQGDKNRCPKHQQTNLAFYEKLEEETQGKGDFSINGTFQIPKPKFDDLYFYDSFDGLRVTAKINNLESVFKIDEN